MDVSQHPRCYVYGPSWGPLESFSDSRSPKKAFSGPPFQPRPFRTRPWGAARRVPNLSAKGGCRHARSGDARSTARVPATSVPDSSRGFSLDLFRNCLAGGGSRFVCAGHIRSELAPGVPARPARTRPVVDLPISNLDPRFSILDFRPSQLLDLRYSNLDPRCLVLDPRSSVLDPRSSIHFPRSSILGPRTLIPDPWSSTLGSRISVLSPRSTYFEPRSSILDPHSSILGRRSSPFGFQPSILHPRS